MEAGRRPSTPCSVQARDGHAAHVDDFVTLVGGVDGCEAHAIAKERPQSSEYLRTYELSFLRGLLPLNC